MTARVFFIIVTFYLFGHLSLNAQHLQTEVSFSQFMEEYSELEEATLLTSDQEAWGVLQWIMNLEHSIQLPGIEERPFNQLGISTIGQVVLWHNNSPDEVELDLYLVPFGFNVVSPLQDTVNQDQGYIFYYMEDDYIVVEFRNVALTVEKEIDNGNLLSRINYKVEINPANNSVRFHYGSSTISTALESYIFDNATTVGVGLETWEKTGQQFNRAENFWNFLNGSPHDFTLDVHDVLIPSRPEHSFTAFPLNGTVYEFKFSSKPTSAEDLNQEHSFRVFPNPGNDRLYIDLSEPELLNSNLEIFDVLGRSIYQSAAMDKIHIDTSNWSAGMYFVRVGASDKVRTVKWVKR